MTNNTPNDDVNIYEKSKGIITDGDKLNDVNAEIVKLNNSCANTIHAKNSTKLKQSAAQNIITQECEASQSAAMKITSEKIKLNNTIVGYSDTRESVCDKTIQIVSVSDTLHATTLNTLVSQADQINAREINAGILIGTQIEGNVKTVMTAQTAAILGAAFGFVYFILKTLFGKK